MPANITIRKPKPILPAVVSAILKRGYILPQETRAVFGTTKKPSPHYSKRTIRRSPHGLSENIWMIPLTPGVCVFANNAVTFYPNHSWGTLCFFTGDQYNHKKTEAHLKKVYDEYLSAHSKA